MDDILIASPSATLIQEVKDFLHFAFTIKDLGEVHYFFCMEVARDDSGITLNQRKYVLDLIESAGLGGSTPVSTPLPPGIKLTHSVDSLLPDPEPHRRLVGCLLYLNLTRPDLSYSVQQLS